MKVLKDIREYFYETKYTFEEISLHELKDNFIYSSTAEFDWAIDWIILYLKKVYNIRNYKDFAYRILGCLPIEVDTLKFFSDVRIIKEIVKTSEGKKYLDKHFPDNDTYIKPLVKDFANFVFYKKVFPKSMPQREKEVEGTIFYLINSYDGNKEIFRFLIEFCKEDKKYNFTNLDKLFLSNKAILKEFIHALESELKILQYNYYR